MPTLFTTSVPVGRGWGEKPETMRLALPNPAVALGDGVRVEQAVFAVMLNDPATSVLPQGL